MRPLVPSTLVVLMTACASAPPTPEVDMQSASPPAAATQAVASAAPSSAPSAVVAAPSLPSPAACRASKDQPLDLRLALSAKDCSLPATRDRPRATLPSAIRVRVEPETATVKSGEWLVLHVRLVNESEAPAELFVERHAAMLADVFGGGELGAPGPATSHGGSAPTPPSAPPPRGTPGFAVRGVTDAKGRSTTLPGGFGILGVLGASPDEESRFVLEPHAEAVATVAWAARGYDPDKSYFPKPKPGKKPRTEEGRMRPPPEPLPPGSYRFDVELPLASTDAAPLRLPMTVEVTK